MIPPICSWVVVPARPALLAVLVVLVVRRAGAGCGGDRVDVVLPEGQRWRTGSRTPFPPSDKNGGGQTGRGVFDRKVADSSGVVLCGRFAGGGRILQGKWRPGGGFGGSEARHLGGGLLEPHPSPVRRVYDCQDQRRNRESLHFHLELWTDHGKQEHQGLHPSCPDGASARCRIPTASAPPGPSRPSADVSRTARAHSLDVNAIVPPVRGVPYWSSVALRRGRTRCTTAAARPGARGAPHGRFLGRRPDPTPTGGASEPRPTRRRAKLRGSLWGTSRPATWWRVAVGRRSIQRSFPSRPDAWTAGDGGGRLIAAGPGSRAPDPPVAPAGCTHAGSPDSPTRSLRTGASSKALASASMNASQILRFAARVESMARDLYAEPPSPSPISPSCGRCSRCCTGGGAARHAHPAPRRTHGRAPWSEEEELEHFRGRAPRRDGEGARGRPGTGERGGRRAERRRPAAAPHGDGSASSDASTRRSSRAARRPRSDSSSRRSPPRTPGTRRRSRPGLRGAPL